VEKYFFVVFSKFIFGVFEVFAKKLDLVSHHGCVVKGRGDVVQKNKIDFFFGSVNFCF